MSENVLSRERPAEEPLAGEVAVDPTTGRPAGRAQALVLLFSSCLAVLGAVLLAPVLPQAAGTLWAAIGGEGEVSGQAIDHAFEWSGSGRVTPLAAPLFPRIEVETPATPAPAAR